MKMNWHFFGTCKNYILLQVKLDQRSIFHSTLFTSTISSLFSLKKKDRKEKNDMQHKQSRKQVKWFSVCLNKKKNEMQMMG